MNENTLLFFVNKSNSSGQKQLSIMDSMHYPQLPPDFLLLAQQLLALLLRTHFAHKKTNLLQLFFFVLVMKFLCV